jgi:hypothetical protein
MQLQQLSSNNDSGNSNNVLRKIWVQTIRGFL